MPKGKSPFLNCAPNIFLPRIRLAAAEEAHDYFREEAG